MRDELTIHGQPNTGTATTIFSPDALDKLLRFAEVMANGRVTVPAHLAGKPADCLAVTMQATQWGMNPFAVAQKTFTINGTLGYEAQLVNAVVTAMAPTRDRLHYEWFGQWEKIIGQFAEKTSPKGNKYIAPAWQLADEAGCGVRVWATMKGEEEPRILELMLSQAQVRNSTLWASDPKQQLAYLAVKRWARLHCPDVILGVYTPDELETHEKPERDITPGNPADINAFIRQRKGARPEAKATDSPEANVTSSREKLAGTRQGASPHPVTFTLASVKPGRLTALSNADDEHTDKEADERLPDALLADFCEAALNAKSVNTLAKCFAYASRALGSTPSLMDKATDVFLCRKAELEEEAAKNSQNTSPGGEQGNE